ncbi:rRNA maturation RNase YbeY [Mesobacterium sp. TK19101]|uniref:Endoribonuclease YbeY n=1 Tax=Mesobacterium hydrothermale TaxID=3111907 RepID=A0ABU6HCZ6_9RHOB|nr:rRNA maturation RNase YbeY [Mesobacterium sp. TK19101]MEC3860325.1 rRNA maturation RNase YbeY [Mesobacterium sp. TK19101]
MLTETILEDDRWHGVGFAGLAETAATAVLNHLELPPEGYEIAVLACDDARIATLNADFRGKPQPTNVLSWPAWDLSAENDGGDPDLPPEAEPDDPEPLGDIAIALETCQREATEQGKTVTDHVTHLIVHATLHLLGYDHIRDGDATLMESLETVILGKLGIADPYMDNYGA